MTNHLHLLATPEDAAAVGQCIQSFGVRYARYFNERYGRTGTLWEERYFSEVIDSELYFFQCSRYIELNPVRANIVQNPEEFSASSFRRNALGEADTIVSPHPLYQALAQSAAERATAYRFIFKDHLELVDAQRERLSTKCPWRVSY